MSRDRCYQPAIAIGPIMPGWGSWDWVGSDMAGELAKYYRVETFQLEENRACDVRLVVKHPQLHLQASGRKASACIYCPVDLYGSPAEIDADSRYLRTCSRIIVHCERLRRYFEPYAPVEYLDHHVKFTVPVWKRFRAKGHILWVGVRTNLPPLVEWVNEHPLPAPLCVLTNVEDPKCIPSPEDLGFHPDMPIRVENWTPDDHLRLLKTARAAIDIKGDDFRSRHKPPAKAIDFLASGIPLAMNDGTAAREHLARMGFEIVSPLQPDYWLSEEYWQETQRFGTAIRELLSKERVGRRFRRIINEVLAERR